MGYDLYHAEYVAETIIARTGRRNQHDRSSSAAMRSLRLAKVLENDDTGLEQMTQYSGPAKSKYISVQTQEFTEERDDADEYDIGLVDESRWSRRANREFV